MTWPPLFRKRSVPGRLDGFSSNEDNRKLKSPLLGVVTRFKSMSITRHTVRAFIRGKKLKRWAKGGKIKNTVICDRTCLLFRNEVGAECALDNMFEFT